MLDDDVYDREEDEEGLDDAEGRWECWDDEELIDDEDE
jgi:hypothetical protein